MVRAARAFLTVPQKPVDRLCRDSYFSWWEYIHRQADREHVARTQDQRKAETRQRLLSAAAELFAREGYDAVSVDAIGDLADRTSGSVYAHFGGKQGLLLALLEGFQDDLAAVMEAELAIRGDLPSRLLSLWRNISDPPEGSGWFLLEIELWLRAARDEVLAGPLGERYRSLHQMLGDELDRWIGEFDLTPAVPTDGLAQAVIGTLIGLEMQSRMAPEAITDEVAVSVLSALLGADVSVPSPDA